MTDLHTLYLYRLQQAEETLKEAEKMLAENFTPRSIINRSYYAMFYMLLALYLKTGTIVKTSRHSGIIAILDKEFIHKKKIAKKYSKILHNAFLVRLENDYQEVVKISIDDAAKHVNEAKEFIAAIKSYTGNLQDEH